MERSRPRVSLVCVCRVKERGSLTNVFVGGIPSDQQTIEDAQVVRGFQGCVHLVSEIET